MIVFVLAMSVLISFYRLVILYKKFYFNLSSFCQKKSLKLFKSDIFDT